MEGDPYDQPADVYSLGVTGIELLTGSVRRASIDQAAVPDELHELLEAMTSRAPERRPQVAEIIDVLENLPDEASAPAPGPSLGWVLGGLAALAGLAAAYATMNAQDENGRWHGRDGKFRPGPWG